MPFNPLTDLTPVIQISSFPLVLEVHPSVGVKTVSELVTMAKAGKPVLNFASAGNGTPQHLAGELFNTQMNVKMTHVPYKGAGPALNDLLGGQVNVMFDVLGSSLQYIQAGKLTALAVTSAKRSPQLPNVPTMSEAGIAGYEFTGWHGIAVRAGTPAPIVDKLNATLNAIFADTEFHKKWEALGTPVVGGTAAQFAELIKKESVRLGKVVKDAGVTLDVASPAGKHGRRLGRRCTNSAGRIGSARAGGGFVLRGSARPSGGGIGSGSRHCKQTAHTALKREM